MKHFLHSLFLLSTLFFPLSTYAQGWPANYQGVMLQGFYWDSYSDSRWTVLEKQAADLAPFFSLVWIPQSANCGGGQSMGYDDYYWFSNYNSSFGTESELRSMINTFKQKGIKTIADVVINHRKNVSSRVDFPQETYKGITYQLLSTDICANDDNGATLKWAKDNGYSLSSNNDTGQDWDGMRDLDHYSANVQTNVKAYLDFLKNELGYGGFRYDMVKGYAGEFTGIYNTAAKPEFSVGEYWDGNVSAVQGWLNATKVDGAIQSAAFDFPFRYTVRDAINNNDWTKLNNSSTLAAKSDYRRYAVTFVENHDTEYRSASDQQDPIRRDTLAANAYLLAMPGTPCVFYKHWLDYKQEIAQMVELRNMAGINNQSTYVVSASNTNYFAVTTVGKNYNLRSVVGKNASYYSPGTGYVLASKGYHWAYYLEKKAETAWVTLPSGSYAKEQQAVLRAISETSGAKLVYTLDGTKPTASSKQVASETAITIPEGETTLTVGLLKNGVVSGIITRHYTIEAFNPYTITVGVNLDQVGWSNVNFWTWGGNGTHAPDNKSWPGDRVTTQTVLAGKTFYTRQYTISSLTDCVNFVFSTSGGTSQTVDINNVSQTTYFSVSTSKIDGKHTVDNITNDVTSGIEGVTAQHESPHVPQCYNLKGQRVTDTYKGIIIKNRKKLLSR